jgi:hypothetical protein
MCRGWYIEGVNGKDQPFLSNKVIYITRKFSMLTAFTVLNATCVQQ